MKVVPKLIEAYSKGTAAPLVDTHGERAALQFQLRMDGADALGHVSRVGHVRVGVGRAGIGCVALRE